MAKFKVVTHQLLGASFGVSGGGYKLELEALAPIDAEIVEIPSSTEDEFIQAARDADAIIAKGVRLSEYRKFKRPFPLAACATRCRAPRPSTRRRLPAARPRHPVPPGALPRHPGAPAASQPCRQQARAAGRGQDGGLGTGSRRRSMLRAALSAAQRRV